MKQANIANVAVTEKHSEQLEEKKCINSIKFESESFETPIIASALVSSHL